MSDSPTPEPTGDPADPADVVDPHTLGTEGGAPPSDASDDASGADEVASVALDDASDDLSPDVASYSATEVGDAEVEDNAGADGGVEAGVDAEAAGSKSARVRQLEREGEVAADFLETLLDIADLDGDLEVDVDGDRAAVAIVDSDEGRVPRRLVGPDGKVLDALQELTRLAVQAETGERSRLMLDIAGYRAERRTTLVELAKRAIAEVKESGSERALEPMSAFERKVVHDVVAEAGLVSESEGVEPRRHIVIHPA